ncbi:hypothetical protein E3U55_16275 [Filobacillus milosensis]|uniref:GNAT family N-acetyltransferase n=1 Tax=Filobacillus milosensis TaxID=94137 RepID=A0A4Y8IEP5_9BACI|nr:hypothetical protein [Filobacillus milosensis]TFB13287.1 hypothetical protein E3U55_16275 [Filobacillus milosensis]
MKIRPYEPEDAQATKELFQETIRKVSRHDYNENQVEAWATGFQTIAEWNNPLQNSHSYIVFEDKKNI